MSIKKQAGFSMLEVLVSMVVIMVGALGIAGMQLLAVTSTENARYQNVATILASSLAANMQANVSYWGTPPGTITISGATNTGGPAAYDGACNLAAPCTAVQMAGHDLKTWGQDVATMLPSGTASLSCPGGSPAVCTLTLSWAERNVGLHNATGREDSDNDMATGTKGNQSYSTLVSIL
jgi:type IV pilus assembly protein PilV